MQSIWRVINTKYTLWLILMFPGVMFLMGLMSGKLDYDKFMHATGEFAGRFLVITLIATPLVLMFPKGRVTKWLVRNRRYFGVASFAYALAHTIYYLIEIPIQQVGAEFFTFSILIGWVAFIIFIPLALTSNDASVRWLKEKWKPLQRWVYLAALGTLLHWMFIKEGHIAPALVHFTPVALLQLYRVWKERQLSNQISGV